MIVRLAPIGAFGAMAFTIGKFGLASLVQLGAVVGTFYLTSALFVLIVLGTIARLAGFSILKFLAYIRDELLIVLGASSSEAALPLIMAKLQRLGAGKTTVGLVIPTGYSFNLDGTNIYMTLATLFLAQATNTPLSLGQEATLLGVAMLTLEGAQRRGRSRLHHPRRHACGDPRPADPGARPAGRRRSLHERLSGAHQLRRQRRGDPGHRPLGGRAPRLRRNG